MAERHVRAVRGATTVERDDPAVVLDATRELLTALAERNALHADDIISAIFTVTADVTSDFPARAAREMGWADVPLLCALEIPAEGALPRCIRVLMHVETERGREAIEHVYLHGARALRPDLAADERGA
jgi:chorismate mutase